ncbi:DUF3307 domain-containing protein [Pseudoalteromonas xiamenensis]|uniref:DUF3307 domain-containing protein n=1 Tax=Pseudoalteromonas xiamenensis TaxID=882626 RepID=UPI0027E42F12|nr:DUF3307 domain-containing protein [Pseudoalteromonas xiamenensis]WMN59854.1 DUF3307 domain-containing protein [Pseudoalteromonas xiamenensis]
MNEFYLLLLPLIFTHLVVDFNLQPFSWVLDRNRYHFQSKKLRVHACLHGLFSFIAILSWEYTLGWEDWSNALICAALITISHYFIDVAKSFSKGTTSAFLLDQTAHLAILIVCTWISCESDWFSLPNWTHTPLSNALLILIAYHLITSPASVFISISLSKWPWINTLDDGLPNAGQYIGFLERFLILTFILVDSYAAVGFILAAKSVFRFGDLTQAKDKRLTEYVMLGTLLSTAVTLAIGVITKSLIA